MRSKEKVYQYQSINISSSQSRILSNLSIMPSKLPSRNGVVEYKVSMQMYVAK